MQIVLREAVKIITHFHLYCLSQQHTLGQALFFTEGGCDPSEQRRLLLFTDKYLTKAFNRLCFMPLKVILLLNVFCIQSSLVIFHYWRHGRKPLHFFYSISLSIRMAKSPHSGLLERRWLSKWGLNNKISNKKPNIQNQEKEHQVVPEMIAEKLQGWWRRQRNYNIPKRKTIGEWGEEWFHSCHSPTRYPVCREHSNAVKSWSWLVQFELLICDNFTQQQELASGGSGH